MYIRHVMKKIYIILFAIITPFLSFAQDKSFEFYYIAHDYTTNVGELCDRLNDIYQDALSNEDYAVIFYMPNYDEYIDVRINLPDSNPDDFEQILSELRVKNVHDNSTNVDYNAILDLINKYDFVDEEGNKTYTSVLFCWYVTPPFWNWGNNESLIAKLYFTLELDKYPGYVESQFWHTRDDGLEKFVDRRYPFGTKNICKGINFMLLPF